MPTVIATLKVKEDKIEEARAFFKQLSADTLEREEGTTTYLPLQRSDDPTTFVFYERYTDDAALAEHGKNLAAVGKQFAGVLAGPPEIVKLEEI